jgi:ABC-type antimicrobial peptide transport system permease subunit
MLGIDHPETVIDEPIRIRGIQFIVVGVMALKGQASGMMGANEQILIPILTGRYRIFGRERLNDIFVMARSEADIPMAMAELTQILRRAHRLRPNQRDDFSMRFQTDFLQSMNESAQTFTFLLAGIAAVSLVVGGIGIMTIMLVSVTERTRDIGVRKAIGATRLNILLQFLVEAIVMCLIGGTIGVAFGLGGATAMSDAFEWNVAIDMATMALAVGFSVFIGLVFGVWPAWRAATLDPVEALRYE